MYLITGINNIFENINLLQYIAILDISNSIFSIIKNIKCTFNYQTLYDCNCT